MANDFSTDNSCLAVYRFEPGALTTDSKGGNTLTAVNGPTSNTSDYREGSGSTDLERSSAQYYEIADSALPSDWPFKSGTSVTKGTYCGWFRFESVSGDHGLIGKLRCPGSCGVFQYAGYFYLDWNNGWQSTGIAATTGIWYHVAVRMDLSANTSNVRIYRASDGQVFNYVRTGWGTMTPGAYPWRIGAFNNGTDDFDGLADEVVVFNRLLSDAEIDAIRDGIYTGPMVNDFSTDSRCKALWRFENNLNDSKGGNHLTDVNTVGFTSADKREGGYAADFERNNAQYAYRNDADLDAGFPLKNGDITKKISVCFWCKPESYVNYSGLFTKWNWSGNKRSLEIQRQYGTLKINCGHTDGIQYQNFDTGLYLWNGEWYHVAVVLDGKTDKFLYVRVFRANTSAIYEYLWDLANELWVGDAKLVLGAIEGPGSDNYFDGLLDEMVVFNELLSALEIDAIRSGTYSGPMPQARGVALGSHVGYHLAGFLQADAMGLTVAYDVAPPPKRVFPVPHPQTRWQSHYGKRKFPVVV